MSYRRLYISATNSRTGFSLVELLIVVAILSILTATGFYNFRLAEHRAKNSRAMADLKAVSTALEMYRLDSRSFPPDIEGFIPFFITSALTTPVAYMVNSAGLQDPFNEFEPQVEQWRFKTYRYINIAGRLAGMPAINSSRNPSSWLPVPNQTWKEAQEKYGDYLLTCTEINYKDNYKRDDAGRVKAMAKWHEFYYKPDSGDSKFMEPKKVPVISQKSIISGLDHEKNEDEK